MEKNPIVNLKCEKCGFEIKNGNEKKCIRCGAIINCNTGCTGNCLSCASKRNNGRKI